jgi:hypothetical protein
MLRISTPGGKLRLNFLCSIAMNVHRFILCLCLVGGLGCGPTHEITLYLQQLEVRGPVNQPPLHITRDPEGGKVTVTPYVSFSSEKLLQGHISGHSRINNSGLYQVDTMKTSDNLGVYFQERAGVNTIPFTGRNLRWKLPSSTFGISADLPLSRVFALSLGAGYSTVERDGLLNYHVGIGHMINGRGVAGRLEVGLNWQELKYQALTAVASRPLNSTIADVSFYLDEGKSRTTDLYVTLTINSTEPDWIANPFVQAGFANQSLADFRPTAPKTEPWIVAPSYLVVPQAIVNDLRGAFFSRYFMITPGVYFTPTTSTRLLVGVRINWQSEIENSRPGTVILPFLQFDYTFGGE